jgi:IS6 family transposase
MSTPSPFKWRHFEADIILCAVRWSLRYALSHRDVEELLRECGLSVDHTTVFRWVQRYAPEVDQRYRPHLKATNDSSRVDETYIRINKHLCYLYRAVDSAGATLDFMLRHTRDADAAERFFHKVLQAFQTRTPRVITVDRHAAYPPVCEALRQETTLPGTCQLRQCKHRNNQVEVVLTQMTKTRGLAAGMCGDSVADLDITIGHEDPSNQELHQSPLLDTCGVG